MRHPAGRPLGAALLDAVAAMDRLRSPGGCPWDAEQDHVSLAPYLLEEAYEAFQAIEDGDLDALRDELGDVLLQVPFTPGWPRSCPPTERWSIDDVAAGLVAKLIRRHPHVFGDVEVSDAADVNRNWEEIKAAERGGASALASVPMAAPALTLAATLQRKAASRAVDGQRRRCSAVADRFAAASRSRRTSRRPAVGSGLGDARGRDRSRGGVAARRRERSATRSLTRSDES